jgi:DNA-binding NtrC family response regulator
MADTILVIEDKESMLDMLKQTLEAEGYQVITAKDGAEGIKKLSDERIGLVLTDLKLPKKDGFEVLRAVKDDDPLLPVIVMTAFGTIETAVKAVKQGAYDFLTKPDATTCSCSSNVRSTQTTLPLKIFCSSRSLPTSSACRRSSVKAANSRKSLRKCKRSPRRMPQ